jgi:hypothetical protein
MQGYRNWALLTAAAACGLALSALGAWLLLEWLTGGSRPRGGVALLIGAALGAGFTVAGTFSVTRWSAQRAGRQRHLQLVAQIEAIAEDAARLDTRAHSEKVSDEEAGRLSRILAHDCEMLREAQGVLDFTMRGRIDESYDVLAALFKVRRSLEVLNQTKGRSGLSRLDEYRRAFEENGEDSLSFQITLRGVSNDTDDLRMRLATLIEALRG